MKKNFAEILASQKREADRKIASKIPSWADLEVPTSLAFEQCSSEETASYKSRFIPAGARVADLTGGLGVDSFFFSKRAQSVWYNERNAALAASAAANFTKLGSSNIEVHSFDICPERTDWLQSLRSFAPTVIYADPARRDTAGRKVFLLEDCSPDILGLMSALSETAGTIILKLSPMADITMLCNRLAGLCELHIVSSKGECKELLCICRRPETPSPDHDGQFRLVVADATFYFEKSDSTPLSGPDGESLSAAPAVPATLEFTGLPSSGAAACGFEVVPSAGISSCGFAGVPVSAVLPDVELTPGDIVYEPSAALMKASRHEEFCARYSLRLFDSDTHLYSSAEMRAVPFCKAFTVLEVLPFSKASFKAIATGYPRAEVTAKGIPMSSAELAGRIGCRTGSDIHIFGCTRNRSRILIVTRRTL